MEKELGKIKYTLKVSEKARHVRLEMQRDGNLVVTVPHGMSESLVERFIAQKSGWIADKLKYFDSIKDKLLLTGNSKREYLKYKETARLLAENRIRYYITFYKNLYDNFKINPVKFREAEILQNLKLFDRVNRIAIKNTRSRWGSCSKRGDLNLNYKIALLPAQLADYIIVHELCHLGEFNHSKKFWNLVSLAIPNYKELRYKFT